MELNEKYVYHVYMARSFTKAARLLYLSQPSLSAAVAAKEKALGFRIFDRTTKPLSLTPEGEVYIEMLEGIMRCENDMQHRLKQLKVPQRQKIVIGSSIYTSYFLLPTVCGAFYRRYPGIEIVLDIGNTHGDAMLLQKLDQREIDVVFSYENDEKKYRSYPVFAERMVVAMHKSFLTPALLPYAITQDELLDLSYDREKEKINTRLFLDIPFLSFDKSGSAAHYMANILKHYTISKHSVINAKHSGVHFNMMRAGVGAILTSDSVIRAHNACLDDIVYFAFPEEISTRRIYATLRNSDVVDEPLKHFLEVTKEVSISEKSLSLYYQ